MAASQRDTELVVGYVARLVERARAGDRSALFDLVMRNEDTNEPLTCAEHQKLRFEFWEAHDFSVQRGPTGTGKTFDIVCEVLGILGEDPNARIAIVSSTQGQASKVVRAVAKYIQESLELRFVYPHLTQSLNPSDPWTQTAITVQRDGKARDPSLIAVGYTSALPGARLTHVFLDDMLDAENTATVEGRRKLNKWVHSTVMSRRGNKKLKVRVTNVPWNPGTEVTDTGDEEDSGDLTYHLAKLGWSVLNMDIEGAIWFENTEWDTDRIRPLVDTLGQPVQNEDGHDVHRLTAHGEDDPLWPEVKPRAVIEEIRRTTTPIAFQQNQMIRVRSDTSSPVKESWIMLCKQAAMSWKPEPIRSLWFQASYSEPFPTVTGVDPAFGRNKKSGLSSVFTFAVYPGGFRRMIGLKFGRWTPGQLIDNIVGETFRFNSICFVESNAAQVTLVHWAKERNRALPIRALQTGGEKWSFETGVEGLIAEVERGAWLIPNDDGKVEPEVAEAIRQLLFFTRDRRVHTGDVLMSWWLAWQGAKKCGFLRPGAPLSPNPRPGVDVPGPGLHQLLRM